MQINPLGNQAYFPKDSTSSKPKESLESTESKSKDKLELSDEAKNIQSSQSSDPKIELVKAKIQSNFYNSDHVISNVADKIIKDLKL